MYQDMRRCLGKSAQAYESAKNPSAAADREFRAARSAAADADITAGALFDRALQLAGQLFPEDLDALRGNALPLGVCPRLRHLPSETLTEVAELIHQGTPAQEAVDRFLLSERPGPKCASTAVNHMVG